MTHLCRFWRRRRISGYLGTGSRGETGWFEFSVPEDMQGARERMSWLCSSETTSSGHKHDHHHHHHYCDFVRCPKISAFRSYLTAQIKEKNPTKISGLFDFGRISWLVFMLKSIWAGITFQPLHRGDILAPNCNPSQPGRLAAIRLPSSAHRKLTITF